VWESALRSVHTPPILLQLLTRCVHACNGEIFAAVLVLQRFKGTRRGLNYLTHPSRVAEHAVVAHPLAAVDVERLGNVVGTGLVQEDSDELVLALRAGVGAEHW
jgi:hypothetical protein